MRDAGDLDRIMSTAGRRPAFLVLLKLLAWCRAHSDEVGADLRAGDAGARAALDQLRRDFGDLSAESTVDEILTSARSTVASVSLPLAARCLALGLDHALSRGSIPDLVREFYGERAGHGPDDATGYCGRVRLRPNDPLPLCNGAFAGRRRLSSAGSLPFEQDHDRTVNLALAPASARNVKIWLDFSLSHVVVGPTPAVAAGMPVSGFRAFKDRHDLGKGLLDQAQTSRAAQEILVRAGRHGAQILVLSEGIANQSVETTVISAWKALPVGERPLVIVPGSRYARSPRGLTNSARVYGATDRRILQGNQRVYKAEPVTSVKQGIASANREPLAYRPPEITIHILHRGVKLVVLICRDLLVRDVSRSVEDCGVEIVAVPALTPRTAEFRYHLANWAHGSLITTIFANGMGWADRAIIGRPDLRGAIRYTNETTPPQLPGLAIVASEDLEWVDTPA